MKIKLVVEAEGREECELLKTLLESGEVPTQGVFAGVEYSSADWKGQLNWLRVDFQPTADIPADGLLLR